MFDNRDMPVNVVEHVAEHMRLHGIVERDVFTQFLMDLVPRAADVRAQKPAHGSEMLVEKPLATLPATEHRLTARQVFDARALDIFAVSLLARWSSRPHAGSFDDHFVHVLAHRYLKCKRNRRSVDQSVYGALPLSYGAAC